MSERLSTVADGVWVARSPLRFMGMFEVGTRMTVIRTGDGLVVHSPIAIDQDLKREVDALGSVGFVVAPNAYHHLFASDAAKAWPEAKLIAPAALRSKRKDLRIDEDLETAAPAGWAGHLQTLSIAGSMLKETVLYHAPSKTLVSADLFENFTRVDHWLTRQYLKLGGIYGEPGWHPLLRIVYRDRKAAKASLERVLDFDFERIVIAHGDLVTTSAKDTLRRALAFLLAR